MDVPMKVNAELFYDEVSLPGEFNPAVRHYWDADADLTIQEKTQKRTLREDRRLIVLQNDDSLLNRFWSPHGMLSRDELDLVDVVGAAFPLEDLLPKSSIDEAETWPLEKETAAQLLRISEVTVCDVANSIAEVTEETIKIELNGTIEGKSEGAETKVEVRGKYHFDRKNKLITWFAIALQQEREIGFAAPGFKVNARIRCARQPITSSEALPKSVINTAKRQPTEGELLLEFTSSDGDLPYRAALDRRWYLVKQHKSSAVLRLIEGGDLVTTCKIDRLDRMPSGKQISLLGFQTDVRAALDNNCKEILSADESVNPQSLRVLRVLATGDVQQTPIVWAYCHLSNDDGHRLSLVFTHEAAMASRVRGIDETLTSSIALFPADTERDQAKQARRRSTASR